MKNLPNHTKVLLCYAHPDDLVLSCGGTVAKLCQNAYEVRSLEITDGTRSNNRIAKKRIEESRKSAELLGSLLNTCHFKMEELRTTLSSYHK